MSQSLKIKACEMSQAFGKAILACEFYFSAEVKKGCRGRVPDSLSLVKSIND